MSIGVKVAQNTAVQLAGKVIATVLGLAAVSMMTRYLGQHGFGQYTTVLTFLSFFGIIADFGLTLVTTQMISQPEADEEKIINNLFTMRLVSGVMLLGFGPLAVFLFPYEPIVKTAVLVAALSFLFTALNQIMTGLFQKHLKMDKVAMSEVAGRVVFLLGIISAVHYHWTLVGIMIITVVSGGVNFSLNYIFAQEILKIRLAFDKPLWKEVIAKSWPLAVTIFFNLVYLKTDTLILSLMKSPADVGIYGAAYKVIEILVTLPFMFAGLVLPIMTARWASKNIEGFKSIFQKSFDAMAIIAVPMFVGTLFVAGKTMALIAGEGFFVSGGVLKVLMAAASTIFLGTIFSHSVIAINEQKKLIPGYIFTGITAVIGYLIFIPAYSYYGAAWVTIYSEVAIAVFNFFIFWKKARIFPSMAIIGKAVLASLFMAAGLYFSMKMSDNLFVMISSGAAVYSVVLYLSKGLVFISFKEIFAIPKKR